MASNLLFLTELMGMRVCDVKGRRLGRIRDACLAPRVDKVRIDQFLVGGEWNWWIARHDQISSISLDGIRLRDEQLVPYHDDVWTLRMARDLLDKQIIDAKGRKVVRVNDITFELNRAGDHDELWVLEVDVGMRSVVRRLCQGILPPRLVRRLMVRIAPNSIPWEFCNIIEPDPQRRLRLNIDLKGLEDIHPADLADIVEELSHEGREAVFETIDSEVAAETLSEVEDTKTQGAILESLDADRAADIVGEMSPDEAADVLAEMEESSSEAILEEMEAEEKTDVEELLGFDEKSAGGLMNSEFIAAPEGGTVADALRIVRENEEHVDTLTNVFLVDGDGRLTGSLPVGRLLLVEPTALLKPLAGADDVVSVPVAARHTRVAELVDKYNLMALPVVDEAGALVGVVTADDVISMLRQD
ncbi:MAG TPA: CBS domain-containing protein [Vicinamibacterales bacterium]|nr:CBS domain-containing protein [Vicinamibacterales bacterium]